MSDPFRVPPPPKPNEMRPGDDLNDTIGSMKREIDALQVTVMTQKRFWYKDPATVISFLALAFSFGTTYVSYHRADLQDVQSERQELRGLLQRLAALPKENLEATKRYQGDPGAINFSSSLLNEENALLSRQAAEIAKKLPSGVVSATEYYAIAVALENSYNLQGAKEFLSLAAEKARNFNDEIAAIRTSANLEFLTGHPETGRVKYQEALGIFSTYPGYDQFTQTLTHVNTESQWAVSEAGLGAMPLANEHLDAADQLAGNLPPSPGASALKLQVAQLRQSIQQKTQAPAIGQTQPMLGLSTK